MKPLAMAWDKGLSEHAHFVGTREIFECDRAIHLFRWTPLSQFYEQCTAKIDLVSALYRRDGMGRNGNNAITREKLFFRHLLARFLKQTDTS